MTSTAVWDQTTTKKIPNLQIYRIPIFFPLSVWRDNVRI